ncbi:MAG: aminotransferase class I/II-fold pyridoxal phosphate-dependent enzyme [Chloroflexi bacterium]|nr:aminotransferase class I/II-fold pyridoxal phosphate-dependent enzyme [Ardenticatenaceae bacterium]MBL1131501.1 aminotransferase class I/II-fold pyridoxal phosphate-dependent enzyme [Chloroflexota bacterium]NOG37612.1 aminotransferase class I/II-fold pyridoxal phosphate-dependent enzyme [Chloroflexota bacterium]GIK55590.1 MAG: aminotransferase [Chloroflexota bacterium]
MSYLANRIQNFGVTIFAEMTALAVQHQAINLGQGFPDFAAPDFLKEAAREAIAADVNQYAPSYGRASLKQAIAAKMKRHYGLDADPDHEILVTHGATEALCAAILGLVNPGDEVILFEPFYDSYVPDVLMAGGTPRFYTLRQPDWRIDREELAALFTPKTKLIVVNTPHNPTGKVFSRDELDIIADLCQEHDVLALADEVYEHIVFDGRRHHLLAQLPGMDGRTLTISSLGKTFSVTGWKIGWAIAHPDLLRAAFRTHQFMTFCGAAPLQEAAAIALAAGADFYTQLAQDYQSKRDFLMQVLAAAGLPPIPPAGTYFVMVDIGGLGFADDAAFCRYLTTEVGVAAIPSSAFYHNPADRARLARFAFCKSQSTLEEAARRLQQWWGEQPATFIRGER